MDYKLVSTSGSAWNIVSFQIGNYYQHTSGTMMAVVGSATTTTYGNILVAECSDFPHLKPIIGGEDAIRGWTEITKGKWLSNFLLGDGLPPSFTEKLYNFSNPHVFLDHYTDLVNNELLDIKETNRNILGTIGPVLYDPSNLVIDIDQASHCVRNLRIEKGILLGDIRIMDTPHGKTLWSIMQTTSVRFEPVCLVEKEDLADGAYSKYKVKIIGVTAWPIYS